MAEKRVINIQRFQERFREFVKERDWEQFHTPKNLAMALSVEVSELVEIFQWLSEEESKNINEIEGRRRKVEDELGDILIYIARLADVLGIDLEEAIWRKFEKNSQKYPVHLARGNAKKYNEFTE